MKKKPTPKEFSNHRCTKNCLSDIVLLDEKLNLYVCNEGGVYHICKTNSDCKFKYVGQDKMYYCLFSQVQVDAELVSTFNGKASFNINKNEMENEEMQENYNDEENDNYETFEADFNNNNNLLNINNDDFEEEEDDDLYKLILGDNSNLTNYVRLSKESFFTFKQTYQLFNPPFY